MSDGGGGSRSWEIRRGDCLERLRELDEASVDSFVCDPPYGLEFMGNEWDRFRDESDPTSARHRGRNAGGHGRLSGGTYGDDGRPKAKVSYGAGGKRPTTQVCERCGRRDQFGRPHEPCGRGRWRRVAVDPHAAPPSSLAFQKWCRGWAFEALRVLKPGGHLLAFGGTRTYHRLAAGIEDAGFEVRDTLAWMYGSGFPKSLDVSKALDKLAAAEAERWDGWGTALKPAFEPIVVARKPLAGTVAQNVLEHGAGAINVDGCRVEGDGWVRPNGAAGAGFKTGKFVGDAGRGEPTQTDGVRASELGRWPANVTLDGPAAEMLDAQTGVLTSGANPTRRGSDKFRTAFGDFEGQRECVQHRGADSGGASRFFYCAKTTPDERNAGLERSIQPPQLDRATPRENSQPRGSTNVHPTVKPISLMRWLVRLVTPPGGTVVDPFSGSGTTGCAAVLEGFRFLGFEREAEYADISEARIAWWERHAGAGDVDAILAAGAERDRVEGVGQMSML